MAVQVCNIVVASSEGRELAQHGSPMFPIACYAEDMMADSVAWHWHEEFEYILSEKGILCVDVNKTRVRLNQGEGIFVNSGALHAVEQSPALLHSQRVPPAAGGRYGYHLLAEAHQAHDPAGSSGVLPPQ